MHKSMRSLRQSLLILAFSVFSLVLAGCYEEESGPDNVPGTLRQITRGELLSMNGRYQLSNPEIVVLDEHLGLIREGNLIEFVAGGSLEAKLEAYRDGSFTLLVKRGYSPYVHLRVEKVFAGRDTVLVPERANYDFPILLDKSDYDLTPFEEFDLASLQWNKKKYLEPLVGKKMLIDASIRYANLDGEFYYVLEAVGNNEALVRVDEEEPGMLLLLKALLHENLRFKGGVTFNEVANWGALRKPYKISGMVTIDFLQYGGHIATVQKSGSASESTAD